MGIGHSKELQEEEKEFAEVESRTKFDMNEIVEWYHRFYMDFPDGTIDLEQFKNIYGQLYPEGDSSKFAEFIFKAYDKVNARKTNNRSTFTFTNYTVYIPGRKRLRGFPRVYEHVKCQRKRISTYSLFNITQNSIWCSVL